MFPNGGQTAVRTLREWRAYRIMTKAAVAKALDVHPTTYANMEKRPGDVSVKDANQLAQIFGCDVGEINFFE